MPPSGLKKQRVSNLVEGKGKLLPSSKAPPERNSTPNREREKHHRRKKATTAQHPSFNTVVKKLNSGKPRKEAK